MASLTYIIISFNSGTTIQRYLSPLLCGLGEREGIIVDNASTDDSPIILEESFPECRMMQLKQNIGYGRGANVAIRETQTKYALLINPDLQVTPEQVEALVNKAEEHSNGAIFAPATQKKHHQLGKHPVRQEFIHGSYMLFNVERIREVGLFDENIFLFSEETDLCARCTKVGLDLILFPDIHVNHLKGESSGKSKALSYMRGWHFAWSRSYYYHKHGLDAGKNSLNRRILVYWYKSLLATNPDKRIQYRARLAGATAFKRGEPAFNPDGSAKASFQCPLNPYV